MINTEIRSDKKNKNIIGMIQSCLILILVILIIFMMIQINRLQGTARVINYAGLVRGATQREVKFCYEEQISTKMDIHYCNSKYDLSRL